MTEQDDGENSMSRRDLMKGGLLAAGSAIAPRLISRPAMAQTNPERILLGQDSNGNPIVTVDESSQGDGTDDFVVRHESSGDELRYDESSEGWSVDSLATQTLDTEVLRYIVEADAQQLLWEADYPESGYSRFSSHIKATDFNGTTDPVLAAFFWNKSTDGTRIDTSDAQLGIQLEPRYDDGSQVTTEMYWQGRKTDGTEFRPFQVGYYHSDNDYSVNIDFDGGFALRHQDFDLDAFSIINNGGDLTHDIIADKLNLKAYNGGSPTQKATWLGGDNFFLVNGLRIVGADTGTPILMGRDSGGTDHTVALVTSDDQLNIGDGNLPIRTQGAGEAMSQRSAPTTSELSSGEVMRYVSDGTDSGSAGDLMYAINDAGTIKTQVIAAKSNAT